MSIFGKILDKLGLHKDKTAPTANAQVQTPQSRSAPTQTSQSAPHTAAPGAQRTAPPPTPAQAQAARPAQPAPTSMSDTDVAAKLDRLAASNPQKLEWRTSIVDLMKLLGMESSLAERKELAAELGYSREQMEDSAKMNVWLHKQVLRRIAENGGQVPRELLD